VGTFGHFLCPKVSRPSDTNRAVKNTKTDTIVLNGLETTTSAPRRLVPQGAR
jgi:hypothetical protein